jgi:hypothetical protein
MLEGDGVVVVVVGAVLVLVAVLVELPPLEDVREGALVLGAWTVTVRVGVGVGVGAVVGVVFVFGVAGFRVAFPSETNSVLDAPEVSRLAVCPDPDPEEPEPPVAVPFSTSVSWSCAAVSASWA